MDDSEYIDLIGKKGLKKTLQDACRALKLLTEDPRQAKREMDRAERHARSHLNELLKQLRGGKE